MCSESVLVKLPSWHLPEGNEEYQERPQDYRSLDWQPELFSKFNDEQQIYWT